MKKIYCTILCCLFFALQLSAQSGGIGRRLMKAEKQGDWLFENYSYQDALEAYQKAWQKEQENDRLKLKIAESFRMLNKPAEAEEWYSGIAAKDSVFQPVHYWYYAEALSSVGKYEEAESWYLRYQQEVGPERRVAAKIESSNLRNELKRKNTSNITVNTVAFNTAAADFSPAFYQKGLVLVSGRAAKSQLRKFAWDRSPFLDLYYISLNDTLSPQRFSEQLNSPYHEGPMVFYQDDAKVIFTRNNFQENRGKSSDGVTKLKLYYSEKIDSVRWSAPLALPFNSDEFSSGHPAISKDGTTLYFASDRPGGYGGTDLYKTEFRDGQWQEPLNLGKEVNTEGNEMFPFLHEDAYLYFSSNGHGGFGGLDIFGLDLNLGTAKPINLGEPLNSRLDDFGLIIDETGTQGYFSSNREGGVGNDDVYSFKANRKLLGSYQLLGRVLDAEGTEGIAEVEMQLLDARGTVLESRQTEADGAYSFEVKVGQEYRIVASKKDFEQEESTLFTRNTEGPQWTQDLFLKKDNSYSIYALLQEQNTGEPIDGVNISIFDNQTKQTLWQGVSMSSGGLLYKVLDKKAGERISLQFKFAKEGYLGKTVTYNAVLAQPGKIMLHELMKIELLKVDVGIDIGKIANVQPIFFDLGKAVIRPDAAKELDKIVDIMLENPTLAIELGAHTDARGSSNGNLQLSAKRAKASADYIISKGIGQSRIENKGYGEAELMNQCTDGIECSEEEHQQNRRTEFRVIRF